MSKNRKKNEKWLENGKEEQKKFCELLSVRLYDEYPDDRPEHLQVKIGFALYGPPTSMPQNTSEKVDCLSFGAKLWPENESHITEMTEFVKECWKTKEPEQGQTMKLAFIFVYVRTTFKKQEIVIQEPVIRMHLTTGVGFVDSAKRYYKDWEDYLENNVLPAGDYIYPTGGIYEMWPGTDEPMLQNGQTPAGTTSRKVLNVVDNVGGWVGLGSAVVGVVGAVLMPPVALGAAVVGASTGLWAGGRSVAGLVDRGLHRQTVSLKNSEARGDWLMIAGGLVGVAATSVLATVRVAAATGRTIGIAAKTATIVAQGANITVSGLTVADAAYQLIVTDKEDRTPLQFLQLGVSVFFFTHSIVTFKTPNQLVREAQDTTLSKHRDELNKRQRKRFNARINRAEKSGDPLRARADIITDRNIGKITSYVQKGLTTPETGVCDVRKGLCALNYLAEIFGKDSFREISIGNKFPFQDMNRSDLGILNALLSRLFGLVVDVANRSKLASIVKEIILKYNPTSPQNFQNIFVAVIMFVQYFMNTDVHESRRVQNALEKSAPELLKLWKELECVCKSPLDYVKTYLSGRSDYDPKAGEKAEAAAQQAITLSIAEQLTSHVYHHSHLNTDTDNDNDTDTDTETTQQLKNHRTLCELK